MPLNAFFSRRATGVPVAPPTSSNPRMLFAGERVDDDDPRLRYNGLLPDEYTTHWVRQSNSVYNLGIGHYMSDANADVDFIFLGTRFELYAPVSPQYQYYVDLTIDGVTTKVLQGRSDNVAPSSEPAPQVLWYTSPTLPYGEHTVVMSGGGYGGYNLMDVLKLY
jgi:hypothetical protein